MIELTHIEDAARRIAGAVHKTPLAFSRTFSEISGAEFYLKCENLQKTGSFKVRGAFNKLARMAEFGILPHLVAASAGNHAQGVAYAAARLGAHATIVMPRSTPLAKVAATQSYEPEIILHGDDYEAAYELAHSLCDERGAAFVHPFDDSDIIAGQGTVALELLHELPTVDVIVVPCGGGGLLAGIATCVKSVNPRVRVYGAQSANADAFARLYNAKHCDDSVTPLPEAVRSDGETIADGIAVRNPGALTSSLICNFADGIVTVTDDEIAEAMLLTMERVKLVTEPSGAVAIAAMMNHRIPDLAGKRVACVVSGGNVDMSRIHTVIEQGLARAEQVKRDSAESRTPPRSVVPRNKITHHSSR